MSLKIINESLRAWAGAERPLKSLPKAQLWKYPLANPTPEAEWDFGKELLARLAGHRAIEHEIVRAEDGLQRLRQRLYGNELQLSSARDKRAQLQARLEEVTKLTGSAPDQEKRDVEVGAEMERIAERVLNGTKASIATAEANLQALKAKFDNAPKSDSIVSSEEIHGHYAQRYSPAWAETMRKWQEGALFKAQTYGWSAFLKTKRGDQEDDLKAFWEVEGLAKLVRQDKSDAFKAIHALYCIRIEPSITRRRQYLSDGNINGDFNTAQLKPAQRAEFWRWRRAYARASIAWKWMDDEFGNTYDPNQLGGNHAFNPYEETPEERNARD